MRVSTWFSALWEFLRDIDVDDDPIERLEARVSALERSMTTASIAMPSDNPMPLDSSSGAASPTRRI